MPTVPRALFAALVDDAALFPPGNAPMAQALASHATHRGAWYADLVGPFVCPASRVDELRAALPGDAALDVSLVFDVTGAGAHDALRAVGSDDRLTLAAVEAAHARLGDDAATVGENLRRLPDTIGFLEVSRTDVADGLDLVAKGGWRAAKYRTGGSTPDAVPAPDELAAFVMECVDRDLPFKLTAGLHHAVRLRDDGSGFSHGVLNVLAGVAAATFEGGSTERVAAILDDDRPEPGRAWSDLTEGDAALIRRSFRSFGCCGVTDPIGELVDLGLVGDRA